MSGFPISTRVELGRQWPQNLRICAAESAHNGTVLRFRRPQSAVFRDFELGRQPLEEFFLRLLTLQKSGASPEFGRSSEQGFAPKTLASPLCFRRFIQPVRQFRWLT